MAIQIVGPSGSDIVDTQNASGLTYLRSNLPTDTSIAGFAGMLSEVDAGTIYGSRVVRQVEASEDYRLRVGVDSLLLQDTFNSTALSSNLWTNTATTFVTAVANELLSLNSTHLTTVNAVNRVQSYRTIPILGTFQTYVEFIFFYTTTSPTLVANVVADLGVGIATGTADPTDGAILRFTSSGTIEARVFFNSNALTPVSIPTDTIPVNTRTHLVIALGHDNVYFFINDVLVAIVPPSGASFGLPTASQAMPVLIRQYNGAVAPSVAVNLQVSQVNATFGDINNTRPWTMQLAGNGQIALQSLVPATAGSTANYANSAAPTSATLSNTAAGYTTLGGQWQFAAVAGAETDYALFAFQVPAAAVNITARTLFVTRVRISSFNTVVAVATTATVMQWSVGVGATAVSLATANAAATKAPRIITLGVQSFPVGAAVGAKPSDGDIDVAFDPPLPVEAGNFFHVILKMPIGTATATEIFRGTVLVNGVFE